MLVGLNSELSLEASKKVYHYNREIVYEALTDRELIGKVIINSGKIQTDYKKFEYMRQVKVYLHRLRSQMTSIRIKSK